VGYRGQLRIDAPLVDPGQTVTAAPPVAETSRPATGITPPVNASTSLWLWTTLAALLGWASTTAWLFWRMRPATRAPQVDENPGEQRLWRSLASACERGRASDARAALQQWGQVYFEDGTIPTLQTLRRRFGAGELSDAIDHLEQCLFGKAAGDWSGTALITALRQWRKQQGRATRAREAPLPPLYPAQG